MFSLILLKTESIDLIIGSNSKTHTAASNWVLVES